MANLLVGPVQDLGHPFWGHHHDVVTRHAIGDHDVYAFGTPWLDRALENAELTVIPEEPIDAAVIWDPYWMSKDQLHHLYWTIRRQYACPIVGVFGDWFAGWDMPRGFSTAACVDYVDAIMIDRVGAASLRTLAPMANPKSPAYRPIVEVDDFLTYGRLPTLGGFRAEVEQISRDPYQTADARPIDVLFVGYYHVSFVVMRPLVLEIVREHCAKKGYTFYHGRDVSKNNMERLLVESKIVVNASLGSQLNCRIYEAAASGACLISDKANYQSSKIVHFAHLWSNPNDIPGYIDDMLDDHFMRDRRAKDGARWAARHFPEDVWAKNLDLAVIAAEEARPLVESHSRA